MKHIQTIETRDLCQSAKNGGSHTRRAAGASASPPASLPARPAAVLPIRLARRRTTTEL